MTYPAKYQHSQIIPEQKCQGTLEKQEGSNEAARGHTERERNPGEAKCPSGIMQNNTHPHTNPWGTPAKHQISIMENIQKSISSIPSPDFTKVQEVDCLVRERKEYCVARKWKIMMEKMEKYTDLQTSTSKKVREAQSPGY